MSEIGNVYGIATLKDWIYTSDGNQFKALFGYLVVVTDKHWAEDFRSSEKWQLLVYKSQHHAKQNIHPLFVAPGCGVSGISVCTALDGKPCHILDVTSD